MGETQAQPSQRRGPRACPDVSPWCGVCWRPAGRPCRSGPLSFRAALNRAGGAAARPPSPPAAEFAPPAAGSTSAFLLTVTLFPNRKNRTGFPGRGHTGPHPRLGVEKEIVGPRLWCLAAAGVPAGVRPQRPSVVLMGRPICPRSTPPNDWLLGVSIGLRPSQRSRTSPRASGLRGCPTQLSPQSPVAARFPSEGLTVRTVYRG